MAAFVSGYLAPGVYDRTLLDPNVSSLLGGLRIPVIIGTGQEELLELNAGLIRGSSASVDNKAPNEDVTSQADGTNTVFQVRYYPIVTGEGSGIITNRVSDVIAQVNNQPVPVVRVDGNNGLVTLQLPPKATDTVSITYYFKLTDTKVNNQDISAQADGVNVNFYTAEGPITDGRGNGTPTTSITDVVVKVNGLLANVSEVVGANSLVVLRTPPASGATVTISYWYNQYADTFDLLPQDKETSIVSVGDSPDLNNYIEGIDYIILDSNKIQWGTGYKIDVITHSSGSLYFDAAQISSLLIDDHIMKEDVSSQFTGVESSCTVKWLPIVDGNGRQVVTNDPLKVKAYVNGVEVVVARVDGAAGTIYLQLTPPALATVEVSYYRTELVDEVYTLEVVTAGVAGTGTYKISTSANGNLFNAKVTAYSSLVTPTLMNSYGAHLKANKNKAVDEEVTLTFVSATNFTVASSNVNGTGSGITNIGKTGATYIDAVTGLQFTITPDTNYLAGDSITIKCHNDDVPGTRVGGPGTGVAGPFETGITPVITIPEGPEYVVPGVQLTVSDTSNTFSGDTTSLSTYNRSGNEPDVGATYYMSYFYKKTDYTPAIYTLFKDITNDFGTLDISNQITLSAFLMMINGAVAIMCKQILKQPGENVAADQDFITALQEIEKPIKGIKPRVVHVCTTSASVISALKTHLAQMSSERRRSERTAFIGYAVGTEPQDAAQFATAVGYSRIVAVYPDGAIIALTDERGVESD